MQKRLHQIVIVIGTVAVLAAFQNCGSEMQFSSEEQAFLSSNVSVTCVTGKRLGVWLDENNDGNLDGDKYLGSFVAYSGDKTAAENYNYYSASAHPLVGPTPVGNQTHVFFYEGSDGLSLNFYSNIDNGGSEDDSFSWDIEVVDNQFKDDVILSDDGGELTRSAGPSSHLYEGRFRYWKNTDGGIIGPFVTNDYAIRVSVLSVGNDINTAKFYSADGLSFSLSTIDAAVSSFIIAYQSYEDCQ